ncbi:MAG: hypothetical protein IT233_03770 [Bacteroidia bacterium]|nr:hypothetical protein [Bacteroidia bacterium]
MPAAEKQCTIVPKEKIPYLEFPNAEILQNPEEIKKRRSDLERALSLGNLEYVKVKITFQDNIGCKAVETTVWGLTDKRVILKSGAVIPIHRVIAIT